MRNASPKPRVIANAVRSPVRSSSALVATVVPIRTTSIRSVGMRVPGSMPSRTRMPATAASGYWFGFSDSSLWVTRLPSGRRATRSVNVPPRSIQNCQRSATLAAAATAAAVAVPAPVLVVVPVAVAFARSGTVVVGIPVVCSADDARIRFHEVLVLHPVERGIHHLLPDGTRDATAAGLGDPLAVVGPAVERLEPPRLGIDVGIGDADGRGELRHVPDEPHRHRVVRGAGLACGVAAVVEPHRAAGTAVGLHNALEQRVDAVRDPLLQDSVAGGFGGIDLLAVPVCYLQHGSRLAVHAARGERRVRLRHRQWRDVVRPQREGRILAELFAVAPGQPRLGRNGPWVAEAGALAELDEVRVDRPGRGLAHVERPGTGRVPWRVITRSPYRAVARLPCLASHVEHLGGPDGRVHGDALLDGRGEDEWLEARSRLHPEAAAHVLIGGVVEIGLSGAIAVSARGRHRLDLTGAR